MKTRESKVASLGARLFGGALAPDVVLDTRRRVSIASLACFAAYLVMLITHFILVKVGWNQFHRIHATASVIGASVSLWLYFASASPRLTPKGLLRLAMFAQFQLCFSLSNMDIGGPDKRDPDHFGISIVSLVIVLAPVLIPNPPWKTLLLSLMCATTGPLVLGHHLPGRHSFHQYFNLYAVNYLAAMLSLAPAFVLRRMQKELEEAQEFGSYQLVARLGKGGMGEVWSARHRLLARPAAIKMIASDFAADPLTLKRFEQEVQATALLRSPHTITIYDYGADKTGTFYYVMELLEGLDLAALVAECGPLSSARTIHILAQVLDSLEEAHERGLVHRDIKPENVYLCRLGVRGDFVKVLDFGLALLTKVPPESRLTSSEVVQGTPAFIPPEQALQNEMDGRADLYSVACLAYWLLTAKPVFEASSALEQVMHHVGSAPPGLAQRGATDGVPGQLQDLLLECLQKDPKLRPASAKVMRQRLLEVPLSQPWTQADADEWWAQRSVPKTP
jgi:hypothetical protein